MQFRVPRRRRRLRAVRAERQTDEDVVCLVPRQGDLPGADSSGPHEATVIAALLGLSGDAPVCCPGLG